MLIHANVLTVCQPASAIAVDLSLKYFHILQFVRNPSDNQSKNAEEKKQITNEFVFEQARIVIGFSFNRFDVSFSCCR